MPSGKETRANIIPLATKLPSGVALSFISRIVTLRRISGRVAGGGKNAGMVILGRKGVETNIGAGFSDRYLPKKAEIAWADSCSMARVEPDICNVMFGRVSRKGVTSRDATLTEVLSKDGIETIKGNRGAVKSIESGMGSMIEATPYRLRVSSPEETLKVLRVIRSAIGGKGAFFPGNGRPGIGGTVLYI